MSQAHVLVTDGNERAALAVTRALGIAGIPVIVGAENETSLAGASRYCVKKWRYPSPLVDPKNFIESIKKAIQVYEISSLIAVTDSTTQVLADTKDELGPVGSTIPSPGPYHAVSDKYRLMQLAKELDIPIPDTHFIPDGNLGRMADRVLQYPVVVKPGRSLLQMDGKWIKTSVHFISTREELVELYRGTPYLRNPSLIQQRIEGKGEGIFGLFDHGRPTALFAHRRIREKPPAGGVSVLRESIELPKAMAEYAVRLLQKVGWHGVAMVEFKVERETGIPRLMEINGRFWGSLQLALDAGINFPFLLYQLATGEPVAIASTGYRVGVKSRWLLGDLDHLLLRLFKADSSLRLSRGYPSRFRCIIEFLRLFQKDLHYEIERWDDFAPARYEIGTYLKTLVRGNA